MKTHLGDRVRGQNAPFFECLGFMVEKFFCFETRWRIFSPEGHKTIQKALIIASTKTAPIIPRGTKNLVVMLRISSSRVCGVCGVCGGVAPPPPRVRAERRMNECAFRLNRVFYPRRF